MDDRTACDRINLFGKVEPPHVRFGDEHRQVILLQCLNRPGQFLPHGWGEAFKRFVQQQKLSGAISQMFIGLSSYCQRRFGHCQRLFPSLNSSLVETSHEGMELLAVELPMEGGGMSVVKLRKMLQPLFDLRQ